MKFHEIFMENVNFVGREVESLQEIIKGMAAGMDFADEEGAGFTSDVEEEDDIYREPTEQEVFDRIKEALEDENKKVYMGWFLDYDYKIVPRKSTTLQSDFHVGQQVCIMNNNKICKAQIFSISITQEKGNNGTITKTSYSMMYPYSHTYRESEVFATKEELVKHLMED